MALTIQERLKKEVEPISLDTMCAIMPDYFTTIKPDLYRILHDDITRLRNEKDVGDVNKSNLEQYTETVLKLKELFDQVNQRLPDLVKHESERKRSKWVDRIWQAGLVVLAGVIGWIVGNFG